MNTYDEVMIATSLIILVLGLFGVTIYFKDKIEKLEDTVTNLDAYINVSLVPKIKTIRQLVTDEIINKKGGRIMNKYIKKPVEVEALQIHGNVSEIKEFIGENGDAYIDDAAWRVVAGRPRTVVIIYTLEGTMRATDGDYIIKGVKGEFYPCRKDIFEETYELADPSKEVES